MLLRVDQVSALAFVSLEGFDLIAGLPHRSGHERPNGVFLPSRFVQNLAQRGSVFALEHRQYLSRLAALARRARFRP